MPEQKRWRFKEEYRIKPEDIEVFVQNRDLGEYFEQVMSEIREWVKVKKEKKSLTEKEHKKIAQIASNYIISDLSGLLGNMSVESDKFLITAENFAELISLTYFNNITSNIAKSVLKEMFNTGRDPSDIIEGSDLSEICGGKELEKIVTEVIAENPAAIEDWKNGKNNALQFLIGKTMAKTKGRANPEELEKLFTRWLK